MSTATAHLTVSGIGPVPVTYKESGTGQPVLLLHGGAGPFSVAGFAALMTAAGYRVIVPVHPGFDGTPRPPELSTIAELAAVYASLLRELDLTDACVVGNSIGGWIAAELALAESASAAGAAVAGAAADSRVSSVVLVDAAGLRIDGAAVPDFFALTLDQVAELSYFNPDAFRIDPAALPAERAAAMTANRAALLEYAGTAMGDPGLRDRLTAIAMPVLVVWGAADRMIPVEHGRAYADGIPGARLRVLTHAGHLPQLETPDELLASVREFTTAVRRAKAGQAEIMPQVSIVRPDGGEVALDGPVRLRIIEDGSTTAHRLGIAEITIAPHVAGPPQHRHGRHDEGFYVVAGTARFTVGEESYEAPAGTLVMIPPGAPHTFANESDAPVTLLNTFTPDLYVQYFRDLRDMVASGEQPTTGQIAGVMARYATEPATTYAAAQDR
jgi:pimeloyl-ACP methyl ester carboxylesterase/mannose-6-phosphate isomerase-like protein (cupin superfamily)